ncbi:hypothetical protein GDO81_014921 [Engystomops pustulosus]|uniref:Taste receptor type 2 n=1 Tax=Engystomops pustulosus TaxID=76066 RepID=A0AAV7AK06_ENGPU|nr:hypothetical protein GDO81_014921 [Engystomops pustulosus]
MMSVGYLVLLVVDASILLVAVPGHSAILLLYVHDFMRNKSLDIKDQLFCGLNIFNLLHGLCQTIHNFVIFWDMTIAGKSFYLIFILLILLTTISCTLFFSTWLSVYFCLKIVNLNKGWYIYVQRRFPQIFPWLLLLSVLGSFLYSAPLAFFSSQLYASQNMTVLSSYTKEFDSFTFTRLCSSCPIIFFLHRHLRRIQVSTPGSTIPTIKPHITAVKTITMLMILNAFYFISVTLILLGGNRLTWYYGSVTMFKVSHVAFVVISIRGNPKIRDKMKLAIHKGVFPIC